MTTWRDRWVLIATIAASSMVFIDSFVVNLALPRIQTEFQATAEDVTWIVELYTLVLGSLMLLGGALADRYGRKQVFVVGTVLFSFGSIGCAMAWSIPSMLVLRCLQAVGGMLMTPTSLAIITSHFSGDARARAIALWSAFSALTTTFGPLIGGALIDTFGWRFVFWINIPLAIVVLFATIVHVSESRSDKPVDRLDLLGAVYAILGFGALTYAMLESPKLGWTHFRTGGALIAGIALLVAFVFHELRASNPLIPIQLFKNRTFGAINLATFFLYGALGGLMFEMPFVLIQAHGFSALRAALATMPLGICIVLLSRFGTRLAAKFGTRIVLTVGPLIVASGMASIAVLSHQSSYFIAFLPGLLLFGIGMGFVVAPLTTGVMSAADPAHVGIASAISNTVSRVAGLLTVAAVIPLLAFVYNFAFPLDVGMSSMLVTQPMRAEIDSQSGRLGGSQYSEPALQDASNSAFEQGFGTVALLCALLCVLAAFTDFAGIDEQELRNV